MKLGHEVIICGHDYKTGYHGHGRTTIEIREMPDKDRYIPDRVMAELTWVTHKDTDYLFRSFEMIIVSSNTYDLNESAKVGRRIMMGIEDEIPVYQITPFVVLDVLDQIKSTEIVHDWRLPGKVPIEKLLPQDFKAWRDAKGIKYSTVQFDEVSARADILIQAAAQEDIEWIKEFSGAGMPVEMIPGREAPDPTPARERLINAFPQGDEAVCKGG